jgi:hypothetical protein
LFQVQNKGYIIAQKELEKKLNKNNRLAERKIIKEQIKQKKVLIPTNIQYKNWLRPFKGLLQGCYGTVVTMVIIVMLVTLITMVIMVFKKLMFFINLFLLMWVLCLLWSL